MFTEIRNKKNKLCQVVKVSEVEQCSINALMYKNTEERNAYLLSSMRKHYEETGIPNKQPIEVDVDGIVLSGNTRLLCAIEIGCEYLLAYESDVRCSEMNDYQIAQHLQMQNNDGKRDESDPRVIYQLIKALELLFEKNNSGSFAHSDDRKQFIDEHGLHISVKVPIVFIATEIMGADIKDWISRIIFSYLVRPSTLLALNTCFLGPSVTAEQCTHPEFGSPSS